MIKEENKEEVKNELEEKENDREEFTECLRHREIPRVYRYTSERELSL